MPTLLQRQNERLIEKCFQPVDLLAANERLIVSLFANEKSGCLMASLPSLDSTLPNWAADNIPEGTLASDGIEQEPHVTVLFGFNLGFKARQLQELIKAHGPYALTVGKLSRFTGNPEYDVLKFSIESPQLVALNAEISEKFKDEITPSEYDYHPHLTVAYVNPGTNQNLDGSKFEGMKLGVIQFLFSEPEKTNRMVIEAANGTSYDPDGSPFESANPNTRHVAAVLLRTAQLQSVGNWFAEQSANRLDVLEKELLALLRMDDPTDDDEATLDRLFASAASRIKYAYTDISDETKAELEKLSTILKERSMAEISAAHDVKARHGKLPDFARMPVLGLTLAEHFKAQADGMALKFKAAVRAGLVAKDTLDGLIERVIGTAEAANVFCATGEGVGADNEITDDHFINAEVVGGVIVRSRLVDAAGNSFGKMIQSAIQTVANYVEAGVFESVPDDDKATMGWEWNALHDDHVICPECEALDGQRWTSDFEKVDPQGMEWPGFGQRHFGCLCSTTPVDLESESVAKTPLDSIFQAQDKDSLNASFGKANTEAFLDGRINGRQLLQQDTWKLSPDALAELRAA